MRQTERDRAIAQRSGLPFRPRTSKVRYTLRNNEKMQTPTPPKPRTGNDFLKVKFCELEAFEVSRMITGNKKIDTKTIEAAVYICRSLEQYLHLSGYDTEIISSGIIEKDCNEAYMIIKELITDEWEMDFNYVKEKISIYFKRHILGYPTNTLFYVPLCKMETMSSEIATLFSHFISFLMERQDLSYPDEHPDMAFLILENEEEGSSEYKSICKSYEDGHISDVFNQIRKIDNDPMKIQYDLNHVTCQTQNEQLLVQIMLEGLPILMSDKIINYEEDCEDDEYDEIFDLQRSFGLVWDLNDIFTDNMFENINLYSSELWISTPVQYFFLSPTTDKIPSIPDFPLKLAEWITKLINLLENYE